MVSPLHRCVCHAEADLSLFLKVAIAGLLSYFHGSIEMLCARVVVALLCEELSKLEVGAAFTLAVLELVGKLKISFDKHLHLILVKHGRGHILAADLP